MLLIGAGLLIRSFAQVQRVPPGFNAQRVLTLQLTMSSRKYTNTAKVQETYRDLWTRLARVPGVRVVGGVSALPLSQMMAWGPITIEGRAAPAGERFVNVDQRIAAGDYFRAMEIPLKQGRTFTDADTRTSPRVVIIDERMARQLWPNGDALGKRIRNDGIDANTNDPWITIVGVVGNIKQDALDADSRMALYYAHTQSPSRGLNIVMGSHGEPSALATVVRKEIHDMDPDLPVYNVRTMEQRVDESLARRRFSMLLLSIFAALASGLAAVGIYGVVAFLVAQGAKEMGIRMALGATPRGIGLLVVRHGLLIAAAGIVLGVAGAVVLTRLMQSLSLRNCLDRLRHLPLRRRARGGDRARRQLYPCPAGVPLGSHAIAPLRVAERALPQRKKGHKRERRPVREMPENGIASAYNGAHPGRPRRTSRCDRVAGRRGGGGTTDLNK